MGKKELSRKEKKEFFVYTQLKYLKNHYVGYKLLMLILALFEIIMIVRGIIIFDFSKASYITYFICYILLLLGSAYIYFRLSTHNPDKEFPKTFYFISSIFSACIIIWATVISFIDSIRHGTNDFIVFYTVTIAVAGLAVMEPYLYCSITVPCGIILYVGSLWDNKLLTSSGTIFNYLVFLIIACFIAVRHYNVVCRQMKLTQKLERLSSIDQLTKVKNRRMLDSTLASLTDETQTFCFGLIDIDDFKHINDEYGHDAGDEYLVRVAELLVKEFGDKVYRYGGDEFAIVTSLYKDAIIKKINFINNHLNEKLPDKNVHISAGFCKVDDEEGSKNFFKNADLALYKAKSDGKKTCVFYVK